MNQVDFIICGAQKAGTSALYTYLKEHPEVGTPTRKEVHFFDREPYVIGEPPSYDDYHETFFSAQSLAKLTGEATPIYMYWNTAPRRMWEYNPNLKLIVILRNPIDRAYSHWNMIRSKGREPLSFWDAIQQETQRCRKALPYQHKHFSYIDRGFYTEQLRRLWFYFSKKNVLTLKYEKLKYDLENTLEKVCSFLNIASFEYVEYQDIHSYPYLQAMSNREREYLHATFEYEIMSLERLLDWDCSDWLSH